MRERVIFFLAVILAGFLQNTMVFEIGGVRPNLPLIVLVLAAFFVKELPFYIALFPISFVATNFFFDEISIALSLLLIGVLTFIVKGYLPAQRWLNTLVVTMIATGLFYAAIDHRFLLESFSIVLWEIVYNGIVGVAAFAVFSKFLHHETAIRTTF